MSLYTFKGPPRIISNQTQYGVEGGSVRIECVAFSVPKPDYIIWSFGGSEINSFHNHEYAFLEESLPDGLTKSSLVIRESETKHFGSYNCSVSNAYGLDSLEIHLIPDKTMPLIIFVIGGSGVTILILIIMLIVMLCHKNSNKKEKDENVTEISKEDKFKDGDSSNISDLKLELRQVEVNCEMDLHSVRL
nr:irregular chiasm C-roughest protein-like [Danaus plexippus plexippus]